MAAGEGQQFVIDYMNKLQLRPSNTLRQFWNDLQYKHGKATAAALQRALQSRQPGNTTNEIYVLKNQKLELSLDFAKFSADLYRRFFEALMMYCGSGAPAPSRVLDVGCDNGIVSCFIAWCFPDAEVVGVDREADGLRCASHLADKLGLSNVQFVQMDVSAPSDALQAASFDWVVSVRSVHEVLQNEEAMPHHWSTTELLEQARADQASSMNQRTLRYVCSLLRDASAKFITFERLPWMGSVALWTYQLQVAGLVVDWGAAKWIAFHEVGQPQEMPFIVSRRRAMSSASMALDGNDGDGTAQGEGLKSAPSDVGNIVEDVYQLFAAGQTIRLVPGAEYLHELAEVAFYSAADKRLLTGIQVDYPGDAKIRYELWTDDTVLFTYELTNEGYRKLQICSLEEQTNLLNHYRITIPASYMQQGLKVTPYDTGR